MHIFPSTIGIAQFSEVMQERGWLVLQDFVSLDMVQVMNVDLESAYGTCRRIQVENGISLETEGTLHHLIGQKESFLEFLNSVESILPHLEHYFGGKFILNSFGGNILNKGASYASNIHRDVRTYSGNFPLLLNTLLMLDDFIVENGATLMMTGSHREWPTRPPEEEFAKRAEPATGTAGSLLVFNSNVWHAAGVNTSDCARRSVTPMFCRPFVKPQFDYPRAIGYDRMTKLSEVQRQLLGYYARIPASLQEWYQPPESRMYRPGQG